MIRLKHGNVSKRVGAVFCALALLLHLAFFPLRVRATVAAGALTAVGFAVTVTAFLNLSGIYPFNPDTGEGLTFPEWTDDALQKLIDLYNVAHATAPITAQTVKSYALGATIAVANEGWNRLRAFVDWIKAEYAPADNAQGVQLGEVVSGAYSVLPVYSGGMSVQNIVSNGVRAYNCYATSSQQFLTSCYMLSTVSNTMAFSAPQSGGVYYVYSVFPLTLEQYNDSSFRVYISTHAYSPATTSYSNNPGIKTSILHNGQRYYYAYYTVGGYYMSRDLAIANNSSPYISDGVFPWYDTPRDGILACLGLSDVSLSLSGITADTTTVSVPAEPVADSDFTGMQVGGLGQGVTADALEDVIESGVQNREQPTVRQVEVEIQAGTEVDGETGEVTENPVVIDQADVIPSVAALTAPQAFLDALTTTMTTKFPFCLPFDIMRILSAFVKEPRAPVISLTFHDGFSDADYTVSVDLSPWGDVAAVVRQLESMLLLVGFWLNFDKFNVLNIILGQLG